MSKRKPTPMPTEAVHPPDPLVQPAPAWVLLALVFAPLVSLMLLAIVVIAL